MIAARSKHRVTWLRRACIGSGTLAGLCATALGAVQPAIAGSYVPISGAGSTWSYNAIFAWTTNVSQYGMVVNYAKVGSTSGRQEFKDGVVDFGASEVYGRRPELVTKLIEDLEAQKLKLDELNRCLLCALAARALERGELPPKPLCEYVAELLRQFIKWKSQNQRGSLMFRDGEIAHLLLDLEKRSIPLFPNRAGRRPGQTYGSDIVVKAFNKAGIRISLATVERVWSSWSRVLVRT